MNRNLIFAFALALASYLIRTQGILLILAMGVWLFTRKQYKALAVLCWLTALTQAGVWLLIGRGRYIGLLMMRNPYDPSAGTAGIADIGERVVANTIAYAKILADTLLPAVSLVPWLGYLVGIVLVVLIWRGWKCR